MLSIRFGQIVDNAAFENLTGYTGQGRKPHPSWDTRTVKVPGSKDVATIAQKPGSKTVVEPQQGKTSQAVVVTTPNGTRYVVLEGGKLKLKGDTTVEVFGDKFVGKWEQLKNPAPEKFTPQDITAQAFLMAGGFGTRFAVVTPLPKPAAPLVGRESIARNIVRGLKAHGLSDVLVHTFHKRQEIHKTLKGEDSVRFFDDPQAPGSAGALYKAINGGMLDATKPVLIIGGDAVTNGDMSHLIRAHQKSGAGVTIAVQEVSDEDVPNFGIIQTDDLSGVGSGKIVSFIEKPSLEQAGNNRLGSTGIYVLDPAAFDEIKRMGDVILKDQGSLNAEIVKAVPALEKELAKPPEKRIFDFGMHFMPYWLELSKRNHPQPGNKAGMHAEVLPGYWNDAGNPIDFLRSTIDIANGLMGSKLARRIKQFFQDGVLFWPGAKSRAEKDGAKIEGNVIVTLKP